MVTVNTTVVGLPFGVTALGDKLQAASAGAPLQVNVTVLANEPPKGEIVIWYVALLPALRVSLLGEPVRLKSIPTPEESRSGSQSMSA